MGETGTACKNEVIGEAHSDCDCDPKDPSVIGEEMLD